MILYLTQESRDSLKSFSFVCQNLVILVFTLLFCRGRQRNVQRIITHVRGHCSANFKTFVYLRSRCPFIVVFFNSLSINLEVKLSSVLQNTVATITV